MNVLSQDAGVERANDEPLGLYIHWPFCQAKCPYCDFNSHVRQAIDEAQWRQALLTELETVAQISQGRSLKSVFFGGGTPSLMSPKTVESLVTAVHQYWTCPTNLEITLEANPNSVEHQRFKNFRAAGINRLSLGIQSLNDAALKFLGRIHGRAEALRAIDIAAQTFDRYSFDLIYTRPQQTLDEWQAELNEALSLVGTHLSLYQLTIEPNTAFYHAYRRGDWQMPDDDLSTQLYEYTLDTLQAHYLYQYEVLDRLARSR